MKSYYVPVAELSDADLKALSEELSEAYQRNGAEDDYWLDDEGESRYYEMRAEIHRRFRLANPDWKPAPINHYISLAMKSLLEQIDLSSARFAGLKVGDTIHVRRPASFRA